MKSTSDSTSAGGVQILRPSRPRLLLLAGLLAACGGGQPELPPPRPLVVSSGARLSADPDRLKEIHEWVTVQMDNIREDPTFWIEGIASAEENYPWETLIINAKADTARFQYGRRNPDVETSYMIYAHLHLMDRTGRLEEWLPDAADAEGYELERAIVARLSDSWLLGRTIFDTQPSRIMDELIYSVENGWLDAFLFTARPDAFAEEREAWVADNPGKIEEYREWFRSTFGTEPPGSRSGR